MPHKNQYGKLNPDAWQAFLKEHFHAEINEKNNRVTFLNGMPLFHMTQGASTQIRHCLRNKKGITLEQADNIITQAEMHLSMYFDFCEEEGLRPYLNPPREYLGD